MEKIKNYFILLILSLGLAATFSACSDDDDDPNSYSSLIVGKWADAEDERYITEFKSNGACLSYIYDSVIDDPGRWSIKGDKLTITEFCTSCDEWESETGTIVTLDENHLIVRYEGGDRWELNRIK